MPIYKDTPLNLVLSTINELNPVERPLTLDNATMSPIAGSTEEGSNSEITFRAKNLRGYSGSQTFYLNRLDLGTLFRNVDLVIDVPGKSDLHQALQNINVRYGLNFTTADIQNRLISDGNNFTMVATAESLQYTGSVSGTYISAGYRLGDVIYYRNLPEMVHPIPETDIASNFKSGAMLAFGFDFTEDANILEGVIDGPLDSGLNATSGATTSLIQTMVSYGFPAWVPTGATAATYAASIVTKADGRYDRVLVISNVNDPAIKGPLYLHYNQI